MAGARQRAVRPPDRTSGQWYRRLVRRRPRPTSATLETGRGDLVGVLSGVAAVQLRPGAAARRNESAAQGVHQYVVPDAADGLFFYPAVDPLAGGLAAQHAGASVACGAVHAESLIQLIEDAWGRGSLLALECIALTGICGGYAAEREQAPSPQISVTR